MRAFVRAQWLGVVKSKRLIGTLLFAPVLFLVCSHYSHRSWMPSEYVLVLFAGLISILSSEILHWLTIDEIKDGTFDIILISPLPPLSVLAGKLLVPVVGAALLVFASLCVNNALSFYVSLAFWHFSIGTSLLLLTGSLSAGLIEFVSLLLLRRKNTNAHSILLIAELLYLIGAYSLLSEGLLWAFLAAVLLIPLLFVGLSILLLRKKHQLVLRRNKTAFSSLFGESRLSVFGAFFRKNISVLRLYKHSRLHLIVAAAVPIFAGAVARFQTHVPAELGIALTLSAIPAVSNIFFVYYSSLHENRNQIGEALHIAQVSALDRIAEKGFSAGLVSSVLCAVACLASACVLGRFHLSLLCSAVLNSFLSAFLCSLCFHRAQSFKSESISKAFISLVSILLQCLALLLF